MTTALVPVKHLSKGKSRLERLLDRETIMQLSLIMLEDVLAALTKVPELDRIGVVSPDPAIVTVARACGAEGFHRSDPGLNPSLEAMREELLGGTEEPLLVIVADVPGVSSDDIRALIHAGESFDSPGVVLAPTKDHGTAALYRTPHDVIPSAFGPDSCKRHSELAAQAEVPFREIFLPSLHLDIDKPRDLQQFVLSSETETQTSSALLRILGNLGK